MKTENGKLKTENGKRKKENGKRKTENGKRKKENGKRKTENGKVNFPTALRIFLALICCQKCVVTTLGAIGGDGLY